MTDDDVLRCVHCGLRISAPEYAVHLEGRQQRLQRCGPESGLPYGYNAHAPGTPCVIPCRGEYEPDPRLDPTPVRA